MQIIINNITWNYIKDEYCDEYLGQSSVGIPKNMLKRFIKECGWDDDLKVPPHYYEEDLETFNNFKEDHECYNTDSQIVLMNWLHNKRRKYTLDYTGSDPFWIYHDHCHSQNDVYGTEVCCINSYVEKDRLLEGAEMSSKNNVFIKPTTVIELLEVWTPRFKHHEKNTMVNLQEHEFYPFMKEEDIELIYY